MHTLSSDERLALLLNLAGESATEAALKNLDSSRIERIRHLIREFKADPPSEQEAKFVLQDFERYFQFAMNQMQKHETKRRRIAEKEYAERSPLMPKVTEFEPIRATASPVDDLSRLDPYQIAMAINEDQPKTIALILRQLKPDLAGHTLQYFSDALRVQVFMTMNQPITVPQPIIQKVLRTTFDRGNAILERRIDPALIDKLVETVRSLPKETRRKMMASLKEESAEMAEEIQEKLYRFEDILRLDDRAVQSVLAKIQSDQLVMALTRANVDLATRLLSNMSKRARQSIEEEIGFNERATAEEIEASRFEIAQILARMDEAGEISV